MRGISRLTLLILAAGILLPGTGCSWRKDWKRTFAEDTRPEPKLKKSPYTVNGRRYRPMGMLEALQYRETGEASLYEGGNSIGPWVSACATAPNTLRTAPCPFPALCESPAPLPAKAAWCE